MKKTIKVIMFLVINNIYSQNNKEIIYDLFKSVNSDGSNMSYVYKNFKKRYIEGFKSEFIFSKCYYYSLENENCYVLKKDNNKSKFYIENIKGEKYTGLIESSSPQLKVITYVKNGLSKKKSIYDNKDKLKESYKIKLGKVLLGYIDKEIIMKNYFQYYSNGNVKIKSQKRNNVFYGSYKSYYENGELEFKGRINKKGEKVGEWKYIPADSSISND